MAAPKSRKSTPAKKVSKKKTATKKVAAKAKPATKVKQATTKKAPTKKAASKKVATKKAPAKAAVKATKVAKKAPSKATKKATATPKVAPAAKEVATKKVAAKPAPAAKAPLATKKVAAKKALEPAKKGRIFAGPQEVKILVVDDEPEILELLVPFLRSLRYTVSEAQDGDQALEKILNERPNIVVLDVMMPGLGGWEIARYVRQRRELDPVRIIMATGIGPQTNAATSPLYGADAYLDKPFALEELDRTVKHVIHLIETGTGG